MRTITPILMVAVMCLLLSACGAWQTMSSATSSAYHATFYKKVTTLDVDMKARAMLNPDPLGRSYSVAVRVYQLKDTQRFQNASYDDLLASDKTILTQDLQDERGVVIYPGSSASMSQPLKPDTQYIGIVAFYREAKSDGSWRLVVPKKDLSADTPLTLELVGDAIMLSKDVPHDLPTVSR
ncbi:type VI secretion system lipoprotein TssJ [Dyella caseinilytica]|uniref:Type VI secretion system lipoprotein TssJ n=1 Tax=Dyella caseinilytica TaxID=1849581 RepID=A0ABX7GYA7_9GAMM|nr:type VI secretion system lipoprotein TssJ [Dyella caseinilytica]QRN55018.1 type VI secretion system lipoprotein TssJ [Dyella caseinilytica]GFZ98729.1 type VI secretion system protein VasD [Dyella caseinilytica]